MITQVTFFTDLISTDNKKILQRYRIKSDSVGQKIDQLYVIACFFKNLEKYM